MSGQKRNNLLHGTAVLFVGTLIVKTIGVFYKIPLIRFLNGESLGMYMAAFEIYLPLYALCAAGISPALSREVARNPQSAKSTQMRACLVYGLIGLMGAVGLCMFSKPLCAYLGCGEAWLCLCALAPALPFDCLIACYRGVSQGLGNMQLTAISQIIEGAGKLFFTVPMMALVCYLYRGQDAGGYAAAAALAGVTVTSVADFLFVNFAGRRNFVSGKASCYQISSALPFCLCTLLCGFCSAVDVATIPRTLGQQGVFLYGAYSGIALAFVNVAVGLCGTVAVSCMPAMARSRHGRAIENALQLCAFMSSILCFGLMHFGMIAANILFSGRLEECLAIQGSFQILCLYGLIWCLCQTVFAALQANGHEMLPPILCAVGGVAKYAGNCFLLQKYALQGAAMASLFAALLVLILGLAVLNRGRTLGNVFYSIFILIWSGYIATTLGYWCSWCLVSHPLLQLFCGAGISMVFYILMCAATHNLPVQLNIAIQKQPSINKNKLGQV